MTYFIYLYQTVWTYLLYYIINRGGGANYRWVTSRWRGGSREEVNKEKPEKSSRPDTKQINCNTVNKKMSKKSNLTTRLRWHDLVYVTGLWYFGSRIVGAGPLPMLSLTILEKKEDGQPVFITAVQPPLCSVRDPSRPASFLWSSTWLSSRIRVSIFYFQHL